MDTLQEVENDTIGGDSYLKSSLNMSQGYADHSFDYSIGPWMNSHHTAAQMADFGGNVPTSHMDFTFCSPVVQHPVFGSQIAQLAHIEAYVRLCLFKFGRNSRWACVDSRFMQWMVRDNALKEKYANSRWYGKH